MCLGDIDTVSVIQHFGSITKSQILEHCHQSYEMSDFLVSIEIVRLWIHLSMLSFLKALVGRELLDDHLSDFSSVSRTAATVGASL